MGIFSSDPSPIEKAVIAATNENLTAEDWSKIIEVCDEVNSKPNKMAAPAVEALRKRLTIPNGNVQLYSLTLLNALAQNCGPAAQREIASGPMTSTLANLGTRSTTHRTVIVRLIEILDDLTSQFASDPSLNQIQMVFTKVCQAHPSLAPKSGKPATKTSGTKSSSKAAPQKSNRPANGDDDDDDDEDLRRALELSLREMGQPQAEIEAAAAAGTANGATQKSLNQPKHQVRALYDFTATEEGELTFRVGDVIEVVDRVYKEWWKGLLDGREGIFPVNYVEAIGEPLEDEGESVSATASYVGQSQSEIGDRASVASSSVNMDEQYIFSQVPAVEKLLTILASASQANDGSSIITNKDIQHLYHQIASMRPRLIQLIDEYTLKKQDLVDMNQKLLVAHRTYERLMAEAASGQHRRVPSQNSGTVYAQQQQQQQQHHHPSVDPYHSSPTPAPSHQGLPHQTTSHQGAAPHQVAPHQVAPQQVAQVTPSQPPSQYPAYTQHLPQSPYQASPYQASPQYQPPAYQVPVQTAPTTTTTSAPVPQEPPQVAQWTSPTPTAPPAQPSPYAQNPDWTSSQWTQTSVPGSRAAYYHPLAANQPAAAPAAPPAAPPGAAHATQPAASVAEHPSGHQQRASLPYPDDSHYRTGSVPTSPYTNGVATSGAVAAQQF